MALPGTLLPWLSRQFTDADGVVISGAKVKSFVTGTGTLKPIYADAGLTTELVNPAQADGDGRLTAFMDVGGYDFEVYDSNDVLLYTVEGVEDPGATAFRDLGVVFSEGSKGINSGYTVLDSDNLITVASTGGANPCLINLPAALVRGLPLAIKNIGTVALSVVPNGTDTIETVNAAWTVPAAAGGTFPTIYLVSDGVSAWYILASYGL